jgi:hypothetical protein
MPIVVEPPIVRLAYGPADIYIKEVVKNWLKER